MKVTIDKEKCIGCGACEALCPKSFKLKDGKAIFTGKTDKCTKAAKDACPVLAIIVK